MAPQEKWLNAVEGLGLVVLQQWRLWSVAADVELPRPIPPCIAGAALNRVTR